MEMGSRSDEPCARRGEDNAGGHLCFGNYGGQSIQKGTWGQLMDYLNALHVDHIVMETAHRPPEELSVFRDLRPRSGSGSASSTLNLRKSRPRIRSRAQSNGPRKCSAAGGSNMSIRTAGSGCSSATSRMERSVPW